MSSVRALNQLMLLASEVGDLIELRFDCVESTELGQCLKESRRLMDSLDHPVIITFRPAEQGGKRALAHETRLQFWLFDKPNGAAFCDIEFDLVTGLASSTFAKGCLDWQTVICSHHDFVGVPVDLEQIYERMAGTPARILKVAVHADDVTDCIPVFKLLERARREGREMIAIAMGAAGIATRILGPSRGSFLTYGALETDGATAPGQLTAKELRELYRVDRITEQTLIMGLVGLPVGHSVSPHVHNAAFAAAGVNGVYIPFEVRDAKSFFGRIVHPQTREIDWNLRGLSITAPHKATVMDELDWVEPAAQEIGAVNTVVVVGDALHGYNTDATSVLKPVIERFGSLRDSRCAIIGAGGAASAALWSLRREGACVTVFARNFQKTNSLAEKFGARYENLEAARFDAFDLVINATPLGTCGQRENETPAISDQLRGARFAYDLVYNPTETRFLREARDAGCETLGGLPMLVQQAAEQFKLWTGADAPIEVMRVAAERALQ